MMGLKGLIKWAMEQQIRFFKEEEIEEFGASFLENVDKELGIENERMNCEGCRYYDAYLDTCIEDQDEEYPDCWEPIISALETKKRTS